MRPTLRATIVVGVLAAGGLLAATGLAHAAGCCGGSAWGGRSYGRGAGGSCCMAMGAMPMAGASMPGMAMGAYMTRAAQPAPAAASSYFCPMHPGVVSAGPATCPYCHMALRRR